MKTHEFARHLELLARLLRQLPNKELDPKNISGMQDLLSESGTSAKRPSSEPRPLPRDILDRLTPMTPAEIESFLLSDEEAFTVANLSELVEKIGLTSSKRQSKNALVNVITRHYEALKMHSIMRGTGSNEPKTDSTDN